jgi:hypothetical protein
MSRSPAATVHVSHLTSIPSMANEDLRPQFLMWDRFALADARSSFADIADLLVVIVVDVHAHKLGRSPPLKDRRSSREPRLRS